MQCPLCNKRLFEKTDDKKNKVLRCDNNHSFDISKYGYVNLLVSKTGSGDNKGMIKSRHEFLKKDYYLDLALFIKNIIKEYKISKVLDLGCGEGYFDRILKDENTLIYGLDISKDAITIASKMDHSIKYVVASSFSAPFADKYFDLVLSMFAPMDEKEAARLTSSYLIKVIPNENHLIELKEKLYKDIRPTKILKEELANFKLIKEENIKYKRYVEDITALFKMTPYFYTTHNNFEVDLKPMDVTFDFIVRIYKCN
ncbi:MAG: methyltransferase domain-containing protein [Bacilli bacterium]|nr:methyltransferase domain-containing protein [Bacilli bacterium]